MFFALGTEIRTGRIAIKESSNVHKNLALREEFLALLLAFETPYLRLALEVVLRIKLDETDEESERGGRGRGEREWRALLKDVIEGRLLDNPEIRRGFTSDQLMHPKHQQHLEALLREHLIEAFLRVVWVADKARVSLYLPSGPHQRRLYRPEATIKATKDVLAAFSRAFLSSQGDFTRTLLRPNVGYTVAFSQAYLDEVDYCVTDLAMDLRDGLKLCKLAEILSKRKRKEKEEEGGGDDDDDDDGGGIMSRARYRLSGTSTTTDTTTSTTTTLTINRADCLHNLDEAFSLLFPTGKYHKIRPKEICNGSRDSTLYLLWTLMLTYDGYVRK